jgi:hypothetical protein
MNQGFMGQPQKQLAVAKILGDPFSGSRSGSGSGAN